MEKVGTGVAGMESMDCSTDGGSLPTDREVRGCVQSKAHTLRFHGDGCGLTWGGGPLQQVEVMVDEGLTVVNSVHVDVFILHCVKLRQTKTNICSI